MDEEEQEDLNSTIDEVLKTEEEENATLKEELRCLKWESNVLETQYKKLKKRVKGIDTILEQNIMVLQQIVDLNRSALHKFRGLDFSVAHPKTLENKSKEKSVYSIHNQENIPVSEKQFCKRDVLQNSNLNLSVIPEEDSQVISDVYVQLTPLPKPLIDRFLRNSIGVDSFENKSYNTIINESKGPFTSTPSQIDCFYQIGLIPTSATIRSPKFVNSRRKRANFLIHSTSHVQQADNDNTTLEQNFEDNVHDSDSDNKITIRRKRFKSNDSNRTSTQSTSISLNESEEVNKRPLRTRRPKNLKEPSIQKKLRRS